MKYQFFLVFVVLLLILIFLFIMFFLDSRRNMIVSDITYMRFHYTRGYAMNADISYEINCKEDKCVAIYKPYGISSDDAITKSVDSKFLKEIENLLKKYEVAKWNGFNGNNKYVLDGDSFSLYVVMGNDSKIEASGYMKWPKNYSIFRDELSSVFEKEFK